MHNRILAALLAMLLLWSGALAEGLPDEEIDVDELLSRIELLEEENAELSAENDELRRMLSEEDVQVLVAARFNGGVITVSEAKAEYDYTAYFYEQLYVDESEYEDIVKQEVLENLTENAILKIKAQELGVYEPTEEQSAQIEERARQSLEEMVEYYLPYISDPEKSEEENREAVLAYLAGEDTTLESLIESASSQAWLDRLYEAVTGDLTFTDADLEAYYTQACESAELSYSADPTSYETSRMNGESVLWNPEGYRTVKRILIGLDETSRQRVEEIAQEIAQKTDQTRIAELLAEQDALYDRLTPIVDEVCSRMESGDDFNLLIDEYGADEYMKTDYGRESGYYVSSDSQLIDAEMRDAAMALESIGDISEPLRCQDGIYILRYESDVPSGAVPFEEFLTSEELRQSVAENARREYYNTQVEQWLDEADIEFFPENF